MCSHSSCSECIESSVCDSEDTASKTTEVIENILNNNPVPSTSSSSSPSSPRVFQSNNVQSKEHPPLPTFSHQKQNISAINTKPYVPPLPYLSTHSNRPSDVRINIPKPELKVSAFSKNQHKNPNSRSRYQPSVNLIADNVLLVDPPLPLLKKTSSQDNLFQGYARKHDRNTIYPNSFSTDGLNNVGNYDDMRRFHSNTAKLTKMPKALPRTAILNHKSVVIDVVPKPTSSTLLSNSDWKGMPTQTVGIPLTYSHNTNIPYAIPFQHRPLPHMLQPGVPLSHHRLIKSESMYNMSTPAVQPVIHQHPLISGNIPSIASIMPDSGNIYNTKKSTSIPGGGKKLNATNSILSGQGQQSTMNAKKDISEKNKVKFSDVVAIAVVPEISRKDKLQNDRAKRPNAFHKLLTDPQRELADSLPLCHPNDEYLKDFAPMSGESD